MQMRSGWLCGAALAAAACSAPAPAPTPTQGSAPPPADSPMEQRLGKYTSFKLSADLSGLTDAERQMIPLLIDAAKAMDEAFWLQAYGDKAALMASLSDPDQRRFAEINYGPWDRLAGNEPFVPGVGPKPPGANLYPPDVTREEFEAALASGDPRAQALKSPYTVVRRDDQDQLVAVPYREAFAPQVQRASARLREAAALAEDPGLRRYLELRAEALLTDDYRPSDLAWMEMKQNALDVVIGPIENYEDQFFGLKTAFEAYVLVKDREWSERLTRYVALLPDLQRGLPVDAAYKQEAPGTESDLNAYDAVYYAGDCNAGSKTIAINLPNDEEVQRLRGTRRLQLKNAMRAKFDHILLPIAEQLIAADQRRHVTFDAFFANTMFHEVAHGLGIQNTINGRGTVRDALQDQAAALEEGKADVLGLYMVTQLHQRGELGAAPLEDYYVTFLAGIFRSVRFGAASAHGRANMVRFNFFEREGAFARDAATGTYRMNIDRMGAAVEALSARILRLQGDGDLAGVRQLMDELGAVGPGLQAELDGLSRARIPVDIVFEQGI